MTNRALLQVVAAAWLLGGCGGVTLLNGDDAGDGGLGSVSNDGSTKTSTHDASHVDDASSPHDASSADEASNGNPPFLYDATGGFGESSTGTGPSVTVNPTVYRFYPNGTTPYNFRAANEDPNAIDLQDCDDDIALQFNLTIGGLPTTDTIEVWAGTTDCSQALAREAGPGPHCWQVAPQGTFANSQQEYGLIYVRDITRFIGLLDPSGEFDPVSGVPGLSACSEVGPFASQCVTPIDLYFLYMPPGAGAGGSPDSYTVYQQPVFTLAGDSGSCP